MGRLLVAARRRHQLGGGTQAAHRLRLAAAVLKPPADRSLPPFYAKKSKRKRGGLRTTAAATCVHPDGRSVSTASRSERRCRMAIAIQPQPVSAARRRRMQIAETSKKTGWNGGRLVSLNFTSETMRVRSSHLRFAAHALVAAALLFSLYCGVRANWVSKSEGGGSVRRNVLAFNTRGASSIDGPHAPREVVVVEPKASPCPQAHPQLLSSSVLIHNPRKFHVLTTCQGFSNHWQIRIHYYWSVVLSTARLHG